MEILLSYLIIKPFETIRRIKTSDYVIYTSFFFIYTLI
jgi:hypothetical protein